MHAITDQIRGILAKRKADVTLTAIAAETGVDLATLSRLRNTGIPRMSLETADRLGRYFGYELRLVRTRK